MRYLLFFIPIICSSCFSPRKETSISSVPLKNISYSLSTNYQYGDSTVLMEFSMQYTENDTVLIIQAAANDSIRIGKHTFTYKDQSYRALIPLHELKNGFTFYAKLKDTLCFNNAATMPYYDDLSAVLNDSLRVVYSTLNENDKMYFAIHGGNYTVSWRYTRNGLTFQPGLNEYHPGVQNFSHQLILPATLVYYKRKGYPVTLSLEKSQDGNIMNNGYNLRYQFKCFFKQDFQRPL